MKRVLWIIQVMLFFIISLPLSLIPYSLTKTAGEAMGLAAYYLWKSRRLIAIENLKAAIEKNALSVQARPEEVIKENFKNLGRSFIEILKVYYGTGRKILNSVSIEGRENFEKAKAKGKGIMFITGHAGNWELMALVVSYKISNISVVARPINNPYLNKLVEAARKKYGNSVIYKKSALRNIIRTLRTDGSVGILMDQAVVPEEGIIIDFLHRPAWTIKVPAIIARMSSAPVLPIFIKRTSAGHVITINPEPELKGDDIEDTKKLTSFIEDHVRENPTEWLWIHRRWKRAA